MRLISLILIVATVLLHAVSASAGSEFLSPRLSLDNVWLRQAATLVEEEFISSLPEEAPVILPEPSPGTRIIRQLFLKKKVGYIPAGGRIAKFLSEKNRIAVIQLMDRCSSKCLFCLHGPNQSNRVHYMPFSEVELHLDTIRDSGLRKVSFCLDYEPFSYHYKGKNIADVIEAARQRGLETWLVTHGCDTKARQARQAAEKLAALPYEVYVLLSFHVWHRPALSAPESSETEELYFQRFSRVIQTLTSPGSKVRLEYRWISDHAEHFPELNQLQKRVWDRLKERFAIPDNIVDYDWPIEWHKGFARQLAKKHGIELPPLWTDSLTLNTVLNNITFAIDVNSSYNLLAETLPLETAETRLLMGDLLKNVYSIKKLPTKANQVYWYRLVPPEKEPLFTLQKPLLPKSGQIQPRVEAAI